MPKDTNKRTARQKDADELHTMSHLADPSIDLLTLIEGNTSRKDRTITSGNITTHKGDTDYDKVKKTGFYTTQQSDAVLWTPAAGKKFVITDIIVSVNAAMRVYLQDDATKIWEWHFAANGGAVINLQTPDESATADNVLSITMDAAGRCSIKVLGYEE